YGTTHYIPGIEYWKWMIENPGKIPQTQGGINLKDGNYYFFPGSMLRGRGGDWSVPYALWHGSGFGRRAGWLGLDWSSVFRVVLLEK
ncbi:hypothetical protein HY413_00005, partial [Candidatus Kaiserbacteria bacterium]|nr:hypothetical protein [Candidatus Kaiserbacteria bacterium]